MHQLADTSLVLSYSQNFTVVVDTRMDFLSEGINGGPVLAEKQMGLAAAVRRTESGEGNRYPPGVGNYFSPLVFTVSWIVGVPNLPQI